VSRPCLHCGNERFDRDLEMEHRPECPSITNLWPVLDQDLADTGGFGCLHCDHQFARGEFYTHAPFTDEEGHTHDGIYVIVCLSCALASGSP